MTPFVWRAVRLIFLAFSLALCAVRPALAAPYAAMVMDARTGEVLHASNADTRLHPASLTKMMTLYIAFEAIRMGEISLNSKVRISQHAASEPPSRLGLRSGQQIEFRYLIRAASVKSANDAATAIAEAISDTEAAFARRMNRTALALGMTRTTFKNAHGLTEAGHLSTARDMTVMGRRLFYDYNQYYNLFSRQSTDAGLRTVQNTNRRLLAAYRGADGIKTGYTNAAGFNLVASAERGDVRVIATVFGGRSGATRNARVAELLDLGFREAPRRVTERVPPLPVYNGSGRSSRQIGAPSRSLRPMPRPDRLTPDLLAQVQDGVDAVVTEAMETAALLDGTEDDMGRTPSAAELASLRPRMRPEDGMAEGGTLDGGLGDDLGDIEVADVSAGARIAPTARSGQISPDLSLVDGPAVQLIVAPAPEEEPALPVDNTPRIGRFEIVAVEEAEPLIVSRASSRGGAQTWTVAIGGYTSRYEAERALLQVAMRDTTTLTHSQRSVGQAAGAFEARFSGLDEVEATQACRRLMAQRFVCTATPAKGG